MGNVIGIVAEYNPFHNGHARLIEQTRARLGADCLQRFDGMFAFALWGCPPPPSVLRP